MLERLRIQNFKSWQDTGDMAFGSLTGFFGTNSSGKSSILQFLLMLKQTVESSDRSQILNLGDEHTYVDLGTLDDIINFHLIKSSLLFSLTWKNPNLIYHPEMFPSRNFWDEFSSTFSADIYKDYDYISLSYFKYQENNQELVVNSISSADYEIKTSIINNKKESRLIVGTPPLKFYDLPQSLSVILSDYREERVWIFQLEQLFKRSYYLGPLREFPRRTYVWGGGEISDVGKRGERAIATLLSSRQKGTTIDMGEGQPKRTVEEHVAHWLKELGLIYSFKVQPIAPGRKEYEVRIQRTAESASVFLTDVGFGVSQILPVLVLLFYVPEGSTVILEQPEIHLHPAVQAGLADVFIDAIKRRKLQIILESHSEHLLQRLQRRMAEEIIEPDAVKLYFTSIEEGKSKLTPLQLDEYGNIHNWPAGFFGDAFAESAAKMKAEIKRKMQNQ